VSIPSALERVPWFDPRFDTSGGVLRVVWDQSIGCTLV